MKLSEYQAQARRTMTLDAENFSHYICNHGLGLAGEAGEVIELIKKHVFHGHDLDRLMVRKELGDVLWYLAAIATLCGIDLDDVGEGNIQKLRERYPQGFSQQASQSRVEGT